MFNFSHYLLDERVALKSDADMNLTVFDIDDTLFKSSAEVGVEKDGKTVRRLTPAEYPKYKLKDGESFNFDEFRSSAKFAETAKPIHKVLSRAKDEVERSNSKNKVIILTARADFDDKEKFLSVFRRYGFDIDKVYVERAGNLDHKGFNSTAKNKKVIFNKYLSTGKFKSITFFDDSVANVRSFMSLEKRYPGVEFIAYHVQENGTMRKV